MSERFKQIAIECGKIIGFKEPKVEDELYSLTIGEILVLLKPMTHDFEGEGILAVAEIGTFIDKIPDKTLRFLLAANVGFEFTKGATIGVTMSDENLVDEFGVRGESSVVLSKIFSSAIDSGQKLCEQLNLFVDLAEEWQVQIKNLIQEHSDSNLDMSSAVNMMLV